MGQLVEAKCRNCNFKTKFGFGGNRCNHRIHRPVPAINIETGKLESVNYHEHSDNEIYTFYSDAKLKGNNFTNPTINNGELKLNMANNFCPECRTFNLMFWSTVFTD